MHIYSTICRMAQFFFAQSWSYVKVWSIYNCVTLTLIMANSTWVNISHVIPSPDMSVMDPGLPDGIAMAGLAMGILVIAVGVFGNVLIILAVVFSKALYKSSNLFVVSLAVCDLFQTLLVKPLHVHTYIMNGKWVFDRQVCLYALFASNLAILESILHVTVIAFYRYLIICHPKCALRMQTLRSVIIVLICIYLFPLCIVVLPAVPRIRHGEVTFNNRIMFCSFVRHSDFQLSGVLKKVVFLIVAAVFLFYCYTRIYSKVRESGRNVINEQGAFSPSRIRREMALLKMVIVTYLTFVVCYLPLSILYGADVHRNCPYIVYFIAVFLLWISSSINWVIYGLVNKQYSAAYKYILCRTEPMPSRYVDNGSVGSRSSHQSLRQYMVAHPTYTRHNSRSSIISAPVTLTSTRRSERPSVSREYSAAVAQARRCSTGTWTLIFAVLGKYKNVSIFFTWR